MWAPATTDPATTNPIIANSRCGRAPSGVATCGKNGVGVARAGSRFSTNRNSTPPQRMQQVRGSAVRTDMIIPHEHSITGMVLASIDPFRFDRVKPCSASPIRYLPP
jgi:hypothetical protein